MRKDTFFQTQSGNNQLVFKTVAVTVTYNDTHLVRQQFTTSYTPYLNLVSNVSKQTVIMHTRAGNTPRFLKKVFRF